MRGKLSLILGILLIVWVGDVKYHLLPDMIGLLLFLAIILLAVCLYAKAREYLDPLKGEKIFSLKQAIGPWLYVIGLNFFFEENANIIIYIILLSIGTIFLSTDWDFRHKHGFDAERARAYENACIGLLFPIAIMLLISELRKNKKN